MDDEKMQIAVYKIDSECQLFPENEIKFSVLEKHIQIKGYDEQELLQEIDGYQVKIFYKRSPLRPKWKSFLSGIVVSGQNILKGNQSWSESFVILLLNIKVDTIYAVTGGSGFHVIQDYTDDNFGVDILSRLIKKDDKILKSVKEKSVMGGVLGTTKFFRKNYNLSENDSFGKIYQELKANLNKEVLEQHFDFSLEELKKESTCIAKSSFKINKSINFDQIFNIIKGCQYVLENPDNNPDLVPVAINSVEKVSRKKSPQLISKLDDELIEQLWKRYVDRSETIDFDLCHKDFEKYLTADTFIVRRGSSFRDIFVFKNGERLDTIDKLFDVLENSDIKPENKVVFSDIVSTLFIYSYGDEDPERFLTKDSLKGHIFGDVLLDDKTYFLIDGCWYEIKENFIKDLNETCSNFVSQNYNQDLNKKWKINVEVDENDYNKKYIGENKTIVLDKVIPENIEPCDILTWDDKNLYFFHVKAGFGNTMRDLCSQVFVAANRLQTDKLKNKEYINKIYDQLISKIGSSDEYFKSVGIQTQKITREEFVKLFDKKLVFVLAVRDTATGRERKIKDEMSKFRSNIAKFSLQELVKGMRGLGVDLQFTQIYKE